jgi:histidyl-tRNA synthetase
MADDKSPRRPRAETPKGFSDYFGTEVTERKAMLDAIAGVYDRYGFDPLETSAVETVEALGKFLPMWTARMKASLPGRMRMPIGSPSAMT